jgi:hypothetical protein
MADQRNFDFENKLSGGKLTVSSAVVADRSDELLL